MLPLQTIDVEGNIELRPYQKKALKLIKQENQGIIWLPVNAGKTYIALEVINQLKLRTLWMTHSTNLLHQTAEKMNELLDIPVGIIGMGYRKYQDITIGMVQTLSKYSKFKDFMDEINRSFDMVIFDECHNVGHNSYYKFLKKATMYYRYGLSGTPKHRNSTDVYYMKACFGDVIVKMSQRDLFDYNVSVKPQIKLVKEFIPEYDTDDYNELYEHCIVNNESRNTKIAYLTEQLIKDNKQTVIMLERIAHGEKISELLELLGIKHRFLHGEIPLKERTEVIKEFEEGNLPVIVVTSILNEGMNIHSMDAIIVAAGGKSPVKVVQRVGRVLRKRVGKDTAIVYDFLDQGERTLAYHAYKRKQVYNKEFGNMEIIEL
jgi:superfamily II DNA or RNA helicase